MPREYMQYGCGPSAPPDEWLNFDASPTLRVQRLPLVGRLVTTGRFHQNVRYGDITTGLPVAENSFRGIYCSHVLEHLSRHHCRVALQYTYSYLEPGGIFRLVVPDLLELAQTYVKSTAVDAAHEFMERSGVGSRFRPRGPFGVARRLFGNSAHLWLWDERSMGDELREVGFTNIRRCKFNDCEDSRFREVEDPARFAGCLAMEASK